MLKEVSTPGETIELQLRRLQSSPHFKHSQRCSSFLDYVVRKTLAGAQDQLKERIIGMEVFHRPPDYDLNADPVVRAVAGDTRKRLTQYYYEPEHQHELRIELHPGSYIPQFKPATGETPEPFPQPEPPADRRRIRILLPILGAAALVCAIFFYPSPLDRFWQPFLQGPPPGLICVGSVVAMVPSATAVSSATVGGHPLSSNPISIADAIAFSNLQQLLSRHSRTTLIQSAAETSFADLQRGPFILVSGFDNPWTMRLTEPLRFHFLRPALDVFEVQDRTDPAHGTWAINTLTPLTKISHDYGLVARFHDPTTDQMVLVAAGIGENGTIAASELLSSKKSFSELTSKVHLSRSHQNVEAVIETQVIDGKHGPPRVVAAYTW